MAEGIELPDWGKGDDINQPDDDETTIPFVDIPASESFTIHKQEDALASFTGRSLEAQRWELLKTKVDAYLKVVADRDGLLPGPHIYNEFVLDEDGRTLYLKDGLKQVTWKNDSTRYLALKGLGTADFIRTHLFPEYTAGKRGLRAIPTEQQIGAMRHVDDSTTAALQGIETIELQDLPQRASDVDTAIKTLADASQQQETSFDGATQLPMREILGLNEALKRTRGALVDNLAKLSQLDYDIAQAEQELEGEEAINNPEKKRRIQERLDRQRDERASRLEAAAENREALRTQFSRIQETIERVLNENTTLADRLRTLFREQGVTIASILTALGFIVSTIVLAIQNMLVGGRGITPVSPTPSGSTGGAADWVKKQLKALAGWLKVLAEKATAALPGVIGAIVSWLLKTAGSVAVWLAEHLWALATALIVAAAVWLRDYRTR